jgi:hypothetical protein
MSIVAGDAIRHVRRGLGAWGRRHPDPSIKSLCRIIRRDLDRCAKEPDNFALQRVLARNVAELERAAPPCSRTCVPAPRIIRIRRDADAVAVLNLHTDRRTRACDSIATIDSMVPRGMVDRDDARQDAFLAMFEGTAPDPRSAVRHAIKAYNRRKWAPLSLDAPIPGHDGLTLHDVIAAEDLKGADDE